MSRSGPRPIPATNQIAQFVHCAQCVAELPDDESPQSYRRYDVGFTPLGIQVWCVRHDVNVLHVDFEGQRHPANTMIRRRR